MLRKRTLLLLFLSLLISASPRLRASQNVLFIAIDDLRPELGCYGTEHVHSPNIDRLAASGLTFDRAYCQVAVCNPSRVSLLTGLRPDSSRVWTLDVQFRDTVPNVITLPQHFKANGYTTLGYGKIFHNPWPDNQSWSEPHEWPKNSSLWSDDAKQQLKDFREQMRADGKPDAAIDRLRSLATEIVDIPDEEHIDGAITQQALKAMRRLAKDKDTPFFLAAGFIRPHLPFVVPRKYWDLYDREAIPLAENTTLPENAPGFAMNTMYELRDYFDYLDTPDPRNGSLTLAQQRELKHGYLASVSLIDAQVGLLLDELDKLGLADNTIVVLWSDHGWKLGEHNSWCKQSNYEIDARVPLIIRSPKHHGKQGRVAASGSSVTLALTELLDLYPTLCELTGLPTPGHVEGSSLVPLLLDHAKHKKQAKPAAFSQFRRKDGKRDLMGYAMRTDTHRYIEWIDRRTKKTVATELYDHQTDPHETTNIAPQPKNKALLAQLNDQLWSTLPEPPDYTEPAPKKTPRPKLHLKNNLGEPLLVYWLPPTGEPKKLGVLKPRATQTHNTTKGHRFLLKSTKSNFTQTITITKQTQTITITPRKKNAAQPPLDQTARPEPAEGARLPNILVLMADDWSWPHAATLGDPTVQTPTFDRVAREGVLFENAFVSAPSCTPSRHAVSSGQYHWRPGVGADLGSSMAADIPVYPDLLAEIGYQTGFSRKGTGPSKHTHRGNDPFGPRFDNFETFFKNRDQEKPFCFWYGAGEPHRPYDWQASHKAGIDLDSIVIPPGLPDNETVRTDLGDYYVKVQRYDSDSARMLALLEASGELENTIVVMTGDNGMPFPRCKSTLYDMGTRVPLAIRWGAKVKGGQHIPGFVSLTDLAPTFLEAAGLKIPSEMSGKSLMPSLLEGKPAPRDFVLTGVESHVYPRPRRAIRTEDFLLIRNFDPPSWPTGEVDGKQPQYDFVLTPWPTGPGAFSFAMDPSPTKQWMLHHRDGREAERLYQLAFDTPPDLELYDLKKDPGQLTNVATHPDYEAPLKKLSQELAEALHASRDFREFDTPVTSAASQRTQTLKGWTIHSNEALWENNSEVMDRALEIISLQLDRVIDTVPPTALKQLREVPLYINPPYPKTRPTAEYHPDASWLKRNDRDPAMAKAMEFTNARVLPFENKRMPYVVLHELSHAYHDRVLGFNQPEIKAAYQRAKKSGTYDKVKRWMGDHEIIDEAYAMTNEKEYFAETTEAFFGKNDYYPFTRKELKKHDPQMHDLLQKLWNLR